jgi:hypothetical protein
MNIVVILYLLTRCAGIFKQSMGDRKLEPSRNRVVKLARQATQPGGIGPCNRFLGSLKV